MAYNIYKGSELIAEKIKGKEYTVEGLEPDTEYSFSVSKIVGEEESEKATITVKTKAIDVGVDSVAVLPKNNNIEVGKTRQLNATVSPSTAPREVTWQSDKPEVATVSDSGLVTGISGGSAVVTVTAGDKTDTASITVTVPVITSESVEVYPATAEIDVHEAVKLNANVFPKGAPQDVTWTSSDPTIARVDKHGITTGDKGGNVTITATTADGVEGTAAVKVKVPEVPVTGIILDPKDSTAVAGEAGTLQINHSFNPENATNRGVRFSIAPYSPHVKISDAGKLDWTEEAEPGQYEITLHLLVGDLIKKHTFTLTEPEE